MQPTNRSSRILQPARPWFIYLSLLIALTLVYVPTGRFPAVPDWVALVLVFWCIREPGYVGMGAGFVLGLLVDIGLGAAMGQHALAYVVLVFLSGKLARRVLWFPAVQQAMHILPVLLLVQGLMVGIRLIAGGEFPGWSYFLSSLTGVLLWAPLSFLLLLPQYRSVDRDDDRPI